MSEREPEAMAMTERSVVDDYREIVQALYQRIANNHCQDIEQRFAITTLEHRLRGHKAAIEAMESQRQETGYPEPAYQLGKRTLDSMRELMAANEELRKMRGKDRDHISHLTAEVKRLTGQVDGGAVQTINSRIAVIEQERDIAQAQVDRLTEACDRLEGERDRWKSMSETNASEVHRLDTEVQQLKQREIACPQCQRLHDENVGLIDENVGLIETNQRLTREMTTAQRKYDDARTAATFHKDEATKLRQQVQQDTENLQTLSEQSEQLRKAAETSKHWMDDHKDELEKRNAALNAYRAENEAMQKAVRKAEREAMNAKAREKQSVDAAQMQVQELQKELAHVYKCHNDARAAELSKPKRSRKR